MFCLGIYAILAGLGGASFFARMFHFKFELSFCLLTLRIVTLLNSLPMVFAFGSGHYEVVFIVCLLMLTV